MNHNELVKTLGMFAAEEREKTFRVNPEEKIKQTDKKPSKG